jgi:hypothetical protein
MQEPDGIYISVQRPTKVYPPLHIHVKRDILWKRKHTNQPLCILVELKTYLHVLKGSFQT